MIIYIEKQAKHYPQSQKVLEKFSGATIIEIDNYKNVFDKKTSGLKEQKSFILAKLESPAVSEAPAWYGHTAQAYFFKTSLNCIYDCSYCYLKWAFTTEHMVFFVNYGDIREQISKQILQLSHTNKNPKSGIWFYSSDYSDIQGMDGISWFNQEFIPFFEKFSWVNMEIRTKSGNIGSLLDLWYAPKNTEIAFSLNPQELISQFETGTASLEKRYQAINTLIDAWWRVGIRLLPLLPVKNYQEIYTKFFQDLQENIPLEAISSNFASWLLYTKDDYKTMIKKYPNLSILHYLDLEQDNFYRESREVRSWFYKEIKKLDKKCMLCLEN